MCVSKGNSDSKERGGEYQMGIATRKREAGSIKWEKRLERERRGVSNGNSDSKERGGERAKRDSATFGN
jgi:hypothetical protein